MSTSALSEKKPWLEYRTVWRWHFYAGLFCIPFVIWLSITGTIFLFKPQIERWLDRPYDHLTLSGPRATANAQVTAALAAVPGARLNNYELPHSDTSAAQILVGKDAKQFRVYVHPQTLQILKIDNEDMRLENFILRMHGELLLGDIGSMIVELAASWAVVMVVTGLFLWWPRSSERLAGVLYPRLRQGKRIFWRDTHAVTGVWVSFFALFLLFTGLPWAKSWGTYLKTVRHIAGETAIKQDWSTSSSADRAARTAANNSSMSMAGMEAMGSEHAGHGHAVVHGIMPPVAYTAIDSMVATVAPLHLADPVLIAPPAMTGGNWTAKSDTRNRPLRVNLLLDGKTGQILKRQDFSQKPWVERVVGTGVAAHEGQLFGIVNQLLGLFTTCGLVLLSISAVILWWRRRPEGVLGAPVPLRTIRFSSGLVAFMVVFGIYMPFLGASIILVALGERFVLRKIPALQHWLGLAVLPAQRLT